MMQLGAVDLAVQALACVLLIYGLHQMGSYRLRGPALAAVAEVLWIGVFIWHGVWGGLALSIVLAGMQSRNFWQWYNDKRSW